MTNEQLGMIKFGDIAPTKTDVAKLAINISEAVAAGYLPGVDTAIQLSAIKQVCEEALSLINESVISELELEGGKSSKFGCKVEKAELGVKYDYSQNSSWVEAKAEEDAAAEKRKQLEILLKTIPPGKEIFDGEGNQLIGPARSSKTGFKTTLAK